MGWSCAHSCSVFPAPKGAVIETPVRLPSSTRWALALLLLSALMLSLGLLYRQEKQDALQESRILRAYEQLNRIHQERDWGAIWTVYDKLYRGERRVLRDDLPYYASHNANPLVQQRMTPVEIRVQGSRVEVVAERWSQGVSRNTTGLWLYVGVSKVRDYWTIGH